MKKKSKYCAVLFWQKAMFNSYSVLVRFKNIIIPITTTLNTLLPNYFSGHSTGSEMKKKTPNFPTVSPFLTPFAQSVRLLGSLGGRVGWGDIRWVVAITQSHVIGLSQ